jgi:hypothetical protein
MSLSISRRPCGYGKSSGRMNARPRPPKARAVNRTRMDRFVECVCALCKRTTSPTGSPHCPNLARLEYAMLQGEGQVVEASVLQLDHRTMGAHPVTSGKSRPRRIHRAAVSAHGSSCRQWSRRTHDRSRFRERTARRGPHLARGDQLGRGGAVLISDPAPPHADVA